MQPAIDPQIQAAISKQMAEKIEEMGITKKLGLAAECAFRLAAIAIDENEDRSLQLDISKQGLSLLKSSAMMYVAEAIKEAYEDGGDDPAAILNEVSSSMVAIVDAVQQESSQAMDRLKNLSEEYRRRFPEVEARLNASAEQRWKTDHAS